MEHEKGCATNKARLEMKLEISEDELSDAQLSAQMYELTKDCVHKLVTKVKEVRSCWLLFKNT